MDKIHIKILKEEFLLKIIAELMELNLKTVSTEEILELLHPIGHILVHGVKMDPGRFIYRNRPGEYGEYFTSQKEISYKENPDKNGRASTGNIIFYGSVPTEEIEVGRLISILETSNILKQKITDCEEIKKESNTLGMWEVKKSFDLIAIVNHPHFTTSNSQAAKVNDSFLKTVEMFPELRKELILISEFIANEFAKEVKKGEEHEYKISSAFTELVISLGFGGIMYPSFKTEFKGFNVALTKKVVDDCLKLIKVGTHELSLIKDQVHLYVSMASDDIVDGKIIYKDSYFDRMGEILQNRYLHDKLKNLINQSN